MGRLTTTTIDAIKADLRQTALPGLVEFLNGASWPHPEEGYLDDLREMLRMDLRAYHAGTYHDAHPAVTISVTCQVTRKPGRYDLTFKVAGDVLESFYWVFYEGIRTGLLDKVTECPHCGRFALHLRKSGRFCSDACRKAHHPVPLTSAQRQQRYRLKNFGRR